MEALRQGGHKLALSVVDGSPAMARGGAGAAGAPEFQGYLMRVAHRERAVACFGDVYTTVAPPPTPQRVAAAAAAAGPCISSRLTPSARGSFCDQT